MTATDDAGMNHLRFSMSRMSMLSPRVALLMFHHINNGRATAKQAVSGQLSACNLVSRLTEAQSPPAPTASVIFGFSSVCAHAPQDAMPAVTSSSKNKVRVTRMISSGKS